MTSTLSPESQRIVDSMAGFGNGETATLAADRLAKLEAEVQRLQLYADALMGDIRWCNEKWHQLEKEGHQPC